MQTGRKILNLRCDRKVSQQDLARACSITPSALSKIEAGINSPRAGIIWKIARNLGVTVEYLLDEQMPYPYTSHSYRQEFLGRDEDPDTNVRMDVSREEKAFLNALRTSPEVAREIAYAIPEVSLERIRLMHFLLNHSTVENPTRKFLKSFETLLTTGVVPPPSSGEKTGRATDTTKRNSRKRNGAAKTSARRGASKAPRKKGKAGTKGARDQGKQKKRSSRARSR